MMAALHILSFREVLLDGMHLAGPGNALAGSIQFRASHQPFNLRSWPSTLEHFSIILVRSHMI